MNLIETATNEVERQDRERIDALARKRELDRINARTKLRTFFKDVLGIDVAELDVIDTQTYGPVVIVDGSHMALGLNCYGKETYGQMYVVRPDDNDATDVIGLDTSLVCRQIKSMVDLGRVLSSDRAFRSSPDYAPGQYTIYTVSPGQKPTKEVRPRKK